MSHLHLWLLLETVLIELMYHLRLTLLINDPVAAKWVVTEKVDLIYVLNVKGCTDLVAVVQAFGIDSIMDSAFTGLLLEQPSILVTMFAGIEA